MWVAFHPLCMVKDILLLIALSHRIVQLSSVPWLIGLSGGHKGQFSRDSPHVFSAGDHFEQLWHGQGCPLFDIFHPAFPLLTMASIPLQGALKDGFGEAVMAHDLNFLCLYQASVLHSVLYWKLVATNTKGHTFIITQDSQFLYACKMWWTRC